MSGSGKVFLFFLGWWVSDAANTALDMVHPMPANTTGLAYAVFCASVFLLLYQREQAIARRTRSGQRPKDSLEPISQPTELSREANNG